MNWNKVTVRQYQQIYPIIIEDKWTDLDKLVKIICILTGKTEQEVDSWKLSDLNDYRFIFDLKIEERPRRRIKVNGKWYRFEYKIQNMPAARYIEGKTFAADGLIENMHRLMASCVVPQRKIGFLYFDKVYEAAKHEEYANDLLDAPIQFVYSACLFFCKVLNEWMKVTLSYLEKESSKNLNQEQRAELSKSLQSISDGFSALLR